MFVRCTSAFCASSKVGQSRSIESLTLIHISILHIICIYLYTQHIWNDDYYVIVQCSAAPRWHPIRGIHGTPVENVSVSVSVNSVYRTEATGPRTCQPLWRIRFALYSSFPRTSRRISISPFLFSRALLFPCRPPCTFELFLRRIILHPRRCLSRYQTGSVVNVIAIF